MKEKSRVQGKEKLLKKLNECDGLWKEWEIERKVADLSTEKDKKSYESLVVFLSKGNWIKMT